MHPDQFVFLVVLIFAFYATPGPATISLVASGASYGFKNSLPYILGLISGIGVTLTVSTLGLLYVITQNEILFTIFKYLSLAYMLYLVYKIWNTADVKTGTSKVLTLKDGLILNSINPKAYIGAFSILTQFVNSKATILQNEFLVAAIIFVSVSLIDFAFCYLGEVVFGPITKKKNVSKVNKAMAVLLLISIMYILMTD
jgi:threonine/homoserine/homoserine lactone efflux protein